jgi:hypothetical protein
MYHQVIQEQLKNIMVFLGNKSWNSMNTARELGAAGIQTAALAFGGDFQVIQQQQKNMMEHLDKHYKFGYSKKSHSRIRYSNICFSFWWRNST